MAKRQKFSDDILTSAVLQYAEVCKGIIKNTELAEWARNNVEGLEEVQHYHFSRPIKAKSKTGKVIERAKLCTTKIEEINFARQHLAKVENNVLLNTSNIEAFRDLPWSAQADIIVDARKQYNEQVQRNILLSRKYELLQQDEKVLHERADKIERTLKAHMDKLDIVASQIKYLMKQVDNAEQRKALESIGIFDKEIKMSTFIASLQESAECLSLFTQALRDHKQEYSSDDMEPDEDLTKDLLAGLID